ncbi:MAG: alpha/beta fold hydrolase [Saprospiraceae bacterium]
MIKKIAKAILTLLLVLIIGFFLGPKPHFEHVDNHPSTQEFDIKTLNEFVSNRESKVEYLKPDNEARIVWADSIPAITEYSIVYLHGFTASQGEGHPIHLNLADSLHANLYLPRLPEHGVHYQNAMKDLTPQLLVNSAKEAIAIGKSIGKKVILMGCSTGGTLAIYLASGDSDIEALVLLSPNIALASKSASLMTGPWGRFLTYQLVGEYTKRNSESENPSTKYWTSLAHNNGLIALQSLIDQTMTDDVFNAIKTPVYCGYYYKNDEEHDHTVSVEAIMRFKEEIGSFTGDIEWDTFERGGHVLGSVYRNEHWKEVQDEVWFFLKRKIAARVLE